MPGWIGHAAPRIARQLRRAGYRSAGRPTSFFVSKQTVLLDGELQRAEEWGAHLAGTLPDQAGSGTATPGARDVRR